MREHFSETVLSREKRSPVASSGRGLGGRFMRLDNRGHLANAMLAMRSVTHAAAQLSENFTLEKRPQ